MAAAFGKTMTQAAQGTPVPAQFAAAVIAGGTASVIGGGKFANGAFQAGFGYILNCGATDCWKHTRPVPLSATAKNLAWWPDERLAQAIGVGISDAMAARELAVQAWSDVMEMPGTHNGIGDAVRHCSWSCSMARELGVDKAKLIGDVHEAFGNKGDGNNVVQPEKEFIMDTWNNQVGRDLFKSPKACFAACVDAGNEGRLYGPGKKL